MSDIIIYGRGKTGQSLKSLAQKEGLKTIFYDDTVGFDFEKSFEKDDVVWLSPGVKPDATGLLAAQKVGCAIVGEFDLCFSLCRSKCVSVTGTNGKTTICQLIWHILKNNDVACRLLGNGGVPFSSQIDKTKSDEVVVLESSSFQLSTVKKFSPYISVLSNVASDHLDYHGSFENYLQAKLNNFVHQSQSDFSVFNVDDPYAAQLSAVSPSQVLCYSVDKQTNCYYRSNFVCMNLFGKNIEAYCPFLATLPRHNRSNALCAILVCAILGVDVIKSCEALESFQFLPHRLEIVNSFNGVTFVDDSKATNVHATVSALQCYENTPLALILGGSDKNCSFDEIFVNMGTNVRLVCAVGKTAEKIRSTAKKYSCDVKIYEDFAVAVKSCYQRLKNIGGVVLMSNACASFDLFESYSERGELFAKIVGDLICAQKN